jgi:hypothetical protein
MKFGTENLRMMPFANCELRPNGYLESHTLLRGVNETLHYVLHFMTDWGEIRYETCPCKQDKQM